MTRSAENRPSREEQLKKLYPDQKRTLDRFPERGATDLVSAIRARGTENS